MSVTLEVSQVETSPLKLVAEANIRLMTVTLYGSLVESSPLKLVAE
jgi:hypothetical protein